MVVFLTMLDELRNENSETELQPRGEDVDNQTAKCDDPAPAAFRIVVLPESGRLAVALQGWKKKMQQR